MAKIVVDSSFKVEGGSWLIRSSQIDPANAEELITNHEAMTNCQLSRWGMHMVQAPFPCLKDALWYGEVGDKHIILR